MSGNHDVGYGFENYEWELKRFKQYFGEINRLIRLNHSILAVLDSIPLDGSSVFNSRVEAYKFIEFLSRETLPVYLFTHIPLYKPKGFCVDDPTLYKDNNDWVIQQNMLSKEISEKILSKIKPKVIFTGHDHYGCIYNHGNITEFVNFI